MFGLFKKQTPEWLVFGLGNPGRKYEMTRHNIGFLAADTLAGKNSISVTRLKFKSLCGVGDLAGRQICLIKPQTFMNLSGDAVREATRFYKIPMSHALIIYDDVSMELGKVRFRAKGSAGGHNGIKDIIQKCGTDEFPRVKIGVGAPPHPDYSMVDWVLSALTQGEQTTMATAIDEAIAMICKIVAEG